MHQNSLHLQIRSVSQTGTDLKMSSSWLAQQRPNFTLRYAVVPPTSSQQYFADNQLEGRQLPRVVGRCCDGAVLRCKRRSPRNVEMSGEPKKARKAEKGGSTGGDETLVAGDGLPRCLDVRIAAYLRSKGIMRLFPVQRTALPILLKSRTACTTSPYSGGVCVAAPTGQGKTLCYSIPIVQSLAHRTVPAIRALVVTPTRELARQVHAVVTELCAAMSAPLDRLHNNGDNVFVSVGINGKHKVHTPVDILPVVSIPLRAVCLYGQKPFVDEVRKLAGRDVSDSGAKKSSIGFALTSNASDHRGHPWEYAAPPNSESVSGGIHYVADIVICTPGRLTEHIERSRRRAGGVLWNSIEWLVIDEADRLLGEESSSSGWLAALNTVVDISSTSCEDDKISRDSPAQGIALATRCHRGVDLRQSDRWPRPSKRRFVRKLLFSATMTRSPKKLAALKIERPLFFLTAISSASGVALPDEISERFIKCNDETEKVQSLICLLAKVAVDSAATAAGGKIDLETAERADDVDGGTGWSNDGEGDVAVLGVASKFRSTDDDVVEVLRKLGREGVASFPKSVVFCASKARAHKLARMLERHFTRRGPDDTKKPHDYQDVKGGDGGEYTLDGKEDKRDHDDAGDDAEDVVDSDSDDAEEAPLLEDAVEPTAAVQDGATSVIRGDDDGVVEEERGRVRVVEFSGNLSQGQRSRLYQEFKAGRIDVVVTSDVLARGIDISGVDLVINYDVPRHATTYVHRAGRTGRAGRAGVTYTMLSGDDEVGTFLGLISECKHVESPASCEGSHGEECREGRASTEVDLLRTFMPEHIIPAASLNSICVDLRS